MQCTVYNIKQHKVTLFFQTNKSLYCYIGSSNYDNSFVFDGSKYLSQMLNGMISDSISYQSIN